MTTSNSYHIPVLLHAAVKGLNIKPDGIYVDVTFGGGGHSKEILKHLHNGKLVGFDQDPEAKKNIPANENFVFIDRNFSCLQSALLEHGIHNVDGILADLGVSSNQFDDAERGFSIRFDAELDMRMNTQQELTAKEIINTYEERELRNLFRNYGEVENAGKLAYRIIQKREEKPIENTGELLSILASLTPRQKEKQYQAKVFQAIRIEVNRELEVLNDFLKQALEILSPGGRLVVISYHSLEDRLVKNLMKTGNTEGTLHKDFYGNPIKPILEITRKPIVPDTAEIEQNPRARSAKLRIAEKINEPLQEKG